MEIPGKWIVVAILIIAVVTSGTIVVSNGNDGKKEYSVDWDNHMFMQVIETFAKLGYSVEVQNDDAGKMVAVVSDNATSNSSVAIYGTIQ